jgi:peptidoglycan/xylan/chitin deacetylase (PgdA/CDA1 family)
MTSGSSGSSGSSNPGSSGSPGDAGASGSGNSGGFYGPQNPDCKPLGAPMDPGVTPQTTFDAQPSYIPKNVIVITLDDVPDDTWTKQDLDYLLANHLKVDFFTNTMNWSGMEGWPLITRMLAEGHHVGNHTVHHPYLVTLDPTTIESEITEVEQTVDMLTSGATPHLTRFRAPYGEPYQAGSTAQMALVEPIVAKYAVHIGWNFDSGDTAGITDGTALFNNVVLQIKTPGQGSWGIMLAHGVNRQTHDMLPMLLPYLQENGFVLGTVEDVVCWMFGKHTWEIIPGRVEN